MNSAKMLTAGFASAMLAALTLTGCAGARSADVPAAGDEVAVGTSVYSVIVGQLYGSQQQRTAAEERAYLTAQQAVAGCVVSRGSTYGIPPFPGAQQTQPAPGDVLAFAPTRADFGIAGRHITLAEAGDPLNAGLAAAGDDEARKTAFDQAVEACQAEAATGDALAKPEGFEALDAAFVDTLTKIQDAAVPDIHAEYQTCMNAKGIKADDLSQAYIRAEQQFPAINYATQHDAMTVPGFTEAAAAERQIAAADAACRAPFHDDVFAAAGPALHEFADTHHAELNKISSLWASTEAQVITLRKQVRTQ